MKLHLNLCKTYEFAQSKLISMNSGKKYEIYLEDNDRFYIYMKPHIINGKVDSMAEIKIDELFITDSEKKFFDEKTFILDTKILVTNIQDLIYAYDLKIKGVSIVDIEPFNKRYNNGEWSLKMCAMKIPYNTMITVSEVSD